MKILEPLFKKVIAQLVESNVAFLLIGGYAVNYYGYGRYTGDIDFWLKPDNNNKEKFISALYALERNTDDILLIEQLDFSNPQVVSMGAVPLRIDFLTKVDNVNFDEAWNKKQLFPVDNIMVPVVDYEHLILTKFSTGRPKDKMDLDELQKINKYRNPPL